MSVVLFVCTTCASTWKNGQRIGTSGGEELLSILEALSAPINSVDIRSVNCMSTCSHACSVALVAPGKYSYVFGDLCPIVAPAILDCAQLYNQKSDGLLGWNERPEPLQKTLLARIPPVEWERHA